MAAPGDGLLPEPGRLARLRQVGRIHKPRVEQAGFAVLKAPDIPSILVETAFISNPDEEKRLRDPAYQAKLVEAMATAMRHAVAAGSLARRAGRIPRRTLAQASSPNAGLITGAREEDSL